MPRITQRRGGTPCPPGGREGRVALPYAIRESAPSEALLNPEPRARLSSGFWILPGVSSLLTPDSSLQRERGIHPPVHPSIRPFHRSIVLI